MLTGLALDLRLFVAGVRRQSNYRLAMLAGLLTNSVFGFIRVAVFSAVVAGAAGSDGHVAGYTGASIVTYTWLSQALIGPVRIWGTRDLADRVRTGDIAVDLVRPVPLLRLVLAHDLGSSVATVVPRSLPILLVATLTTGLTLATDPRLVALGLLAVVLAVLVSALARYTVQLAAFWLVEMRGLLSLYQGVSGLLAGLVVPVALMPGWLSALAWSTPFPAMLQVPADLLAGRLDPGTGLELVGVQLAWVVVLVATAGAAAAAGRRRLVIQGG